MIAYSVTPTHTHTPPPPTYKRLFAGPEAVIEVVADDALVGGFRRTSMRMD